MTAEGKVAPVRTAKAEGPGRNLGFFFVKILKSQTRQPFDPAKDRAISSFMISLVPP